MMNSHDIKVAARFVTHAETLRAASSCLLCIYSANALDHEDGIKTSDALVAFWRCCG